MENKKKQEENELKTTILKSKNLDYQKKKKKKIKS
jgi:hypothetical protein